MTDVVATIKEYLWVVAPISLLVGLLNAYFSWGRRGIVRTFAFRRRRRLAVFQKRRDRLKWLHDSERDYVGWLLSGILWVLTLFGIQLCLEGIVAPAGQLIRAFVLALSRYVVGLTAMFVALNRLTWYARLQRYETTMERLDRAIKALEAKLARQQP